MLTSATVPLGLGQRLGLPAGGYDELDAGQPLPLPGPCPAVRGQLAARPPPARVGAGPPRRARGADHRGRRPDTGPVHQLALHAGRGRGAAGRLDVPVLAQSDLPKPALVESFRDDEATCLFATLGFWQGVDVPGRTLSLVTVDRIPFPRPDEPVLQARRERAGAGAFRLVDLPRAGTLLAQGGPADPLGRRPWGGGRAGQPTGHGRVPGGAAGPGAAHEADRGPGRGRGLPGSYHRRRLIADSDASIPGSSRPSR